MHFPFYQQISDTDQQQSQFLRQSPLDTMFDLSSSALSELIFSLKFVTEIFHDGFVDFAV